MSRPKRSETASEYLERKRGSQVAALITDAARFFVEDYDPKPLSLRAAERRRAAKAALVLLPFVQRDSPSLVGFIEHLAKKYGQQVDSVRPGRRKGKRAYFVAIMLAWGAGELAVAGQDQLTVTELIATAAAIGFDGVDWRNRSAEVDTWRHLRKGNLPTDPEALAEEFRQRRREREKAEDQSKLQAYLDLLRQPGAPPPTRAR
jgi:hypothetical protein